MEVLVINRELSYRTYKRLPPKAKSILDEHSLTPVHKLMAMYLYIKDNRHNIKKCIRKSRNYQLQVKYRETNPKYLINELRFRGFIPLSQFKKFKPKYCHIITNHKIGGDYWVYPENFYINYNDRNKGKRYIYNVWGLYGIQGITKLSDGNT